MMAQAARALARKKHEKVLKSSKDIVESLSENLGSQAAPLKLATASKAVAPSPTLQKATLSPQNSKEKSPANPLKNSSANSPETQHTNSLADANALAKSMADTAATAQVKDVVNDENKWSSEQENAGSFGGLQIKPAFLLKVDGSKVEDAASDLRVLHVSTAKELHKEHLPECTNTVDVSHAAKASHFLKTPKSGYSETKDEFAGPDIMRCLLKPLRSLFMN